MRSNSLFSQIIRLLLCYVFVVAAILAPHEAYAIYDGARPNINFNSGACRCNTGTISFNPFGTNDDYNMQLDNPTCIGFIAGAGAAMLAADIAAKILCRPINPLGQAAGAAEDAAEAVPPPPIPYITPGILIRIGRRTGQCTTRAGEYAIQQATCATPGGQAACPGAAMAATDTGKCCGGLAAYLAAIGASVAALAIIWDLARITYENGRVCGHDWQQWVQEDGKWKKVKGPRVLCLENLFLGTSHPNVSGSCAQDSSSSIRNVSYREFIYGGKEFEDNGDNSCNNPSTWNTDVKLNNLGYSSNKQRYYMTGPGVAPVYACHRFLTKRIGTTAAEVEADRAATQIAYDCCKRRSQNAMCIENLTGLGGALGPYSHAFCEIGSRCTVANITFDIFASRVKSNYACAKTYSVCPYNHNLAGGTEQDRYDNPNDTTQMTNFCQFMNHCSKLPVLPYVRTSNLTGGYISSACRDMKGDSQNVYGYTADLLPVNTRGFSAPMVQCFKETMENIFLNKAGDTQCLNPDETPTSDGACLSGYIFRKGYDLPTKSFFLKVQDSLQSFIKMALTLSIIAFGIAILFAVPGTHINKKTLLTYILKIGLVMYFAVGDAWQVGFMQGVLNTSGLLADITFKLDDNVPSNITSAQGIADYKASRLDGCQFPRFNYADRDESTRYDNPTYPPYKEYLRIWDTLDCKIARALGFGPNVSVPNLVLMILGGFFTGGLGIVFFVATFLFAFFLISLTIRAIHIFLMSIIAVIILMYVSPLVITLSLFARTKPIFDKWWKELLGFTLQPMILFCYLAILIALFDKVVIGPDAIFAPETVTVDGQPVVDTYGRIAPKRIDCNTNPQAKNSSIYCIFRIADIKTFTGFEALGIGLPILANINADKLDALFKGAFLMFIFTKFLDQITGFAASLIGSTELSPGWKVSMATMAQKSFGALRAIQTRAMNAAKKHGGTVARKGVETVRDIGSKGKSVEGVSSRGGADTTQAAAATGADTTRGGVGDTKGADQTTAAADKGQDQTTRATPGGAGGGQQAASGAAAASPAARGADQTAPADSARPHADAGTDTTRGGAASGTIPPTPSGPAGSASS